MSGVFRHNDLRFYVRAIVDMTGADVRELCPGYEEVEQATLETIEGRLAAEDNLNAESMESKWLYIDRALEAISMREGNDYTKARTVESYYTGLEKRNDSRAYIALARTNAEKSKAYLNDVPLSFEVVARNPEQDGEAIKALNYYRDEILNRNGYTHENEKVIADGHDFGSGIWQTTYKEKRDKPDLKFLARRKKAGQPLSWDEYEQMEHTKAGHVFKRLDTFKVLRDRRAKGEDSMSFDDRNHTMVTVMDTMTVTEALKRYPKKRSTISAGLSTVQLRTNPEVTKVNTDDLLITVKETWIKMPVNYELTYPVDVGGGVLAERTEMVDEDVWLHVTRLEGAGIVDMAFDEYDCGLPLTMWFRRASKHHSYGIGAYKDMHAPEWAFNAAFNGKFRWFNRSSKKTTFALKGALTKESHEARQKEGSIIEIDPKSLPMQYQKDFDMRKLVYETDIGAFPSIYDNIERDMISQIDRQGDMTGAGKAYTGRQQALIDNKKAEGMNPIVGNLEAAHLPLGQKFFSNVIQFDGEKPISFNRKDPISGENANVELNAPQGYAEKYDAQTMERSVYAYAVKNSVRNLQFDTVITARSIMPINPTEQRFWIQDQMNAMFPYTETAKGVFFLDEWNKKVLGGLFTDMIDKMKEYDDRIAKANQENEVAEMQQIKGDKEREFGLKLKELEQNAFRLEQKGDSDQDKATATLMNSIVQFMNGDADALSTFMSGDSRDALNRMD